MMKCDFCKENFPERELVEIQIQPWYNKSVLKDDGGGIRILCFTSCVDCYPKLRIVKEDTSCFWDNHEKPLVVQVGDKLHALHETEDCPVGEVE